MQEENNLAGGWAPATIWNQWLQVTLGHIMILDGILTQGRRLDDYWWITNFQLSNISIFLYERQ